MYYALIDNRISLCYLAGPDIDQRGRSLIGRSWERGKAKAKSFEHHTKVINHQQHLNVLQFVLTVLIIDMWVIHSHDPQRLNPFVPPVHFAPSFKSQTQRRWSHLFPIDQSSGGPAAFAPCMKLIDYFMIQWVLMYYIAWYFEPNRPNWNSLLEPACLPVSTETLPSAEDLYVFALEQNILTCLERTQAFTIIRLQIQYTIPTLVMLPWNLSCNVFFRIINYYRNRHLMPIDGFLWWVIVSTRYGTTLARMIQLYISKYVWPYICIMEWCNVFRWFCQEIR